VLIDKYLPQWDVREHHEVTIQLLPEEAYRAVKALDFGRSRLIRVLFAVRGMPRKTTMTLEALTSAGFVVLEEDPPTEVVLGLIGRFWRAKGGVRKVSADDFLSFADPGFVKAAWNFRVEETEAGSKVSTETRVLATDASAHRSLRRYWLLVGPFSALIRREMLRLIKRSSKRPI